MESGTGADSNLSPSQRNSNLGLWVAFQHALFFITLYVSATALAGILHYWVNQTFPEPLNGGSILSSYYSGYERTLVQWYAASLIVAFPLFGILFIILKRSGLARPETKTLRGRQILTYLTIIGAFVMMLSRSIRTVSDFVGGAATMRSFLHLIITLAVSGAIFFYFLWDVKQDRQ